jgi:hypothetical protein
VAYALNQTSIWGSTMSALFFVTFLNHLVYHAAIVKDTSIGSSGGLDATFVSSIYLYYLFKVILQRERFLKKKSTIIRFAFQVDGQWLCK